MVLPKEFVWLEDWKVVELSRGVEAASLHQLHRQKSYDIWLGVKSKKRCFVFYHKWGHRSQTTKRTFFELDKLGTVCAASFWEDIQHWLQALLTLHLAIDDHLDWLWSLLFCVASQQELALDCARDCSDAWVRFHRYLSYEAWHLSVEHDHDVAPTLMVRHLDPRPFVRCCPVRT